MSRHGDKSKTGTQSTLETRLWGQNVCGTCDWWDGDDSSRHGACRRHPPHPITPTLAAWPETEAGDWCGDYTATVSVIDYPS